MHSLEPAKPSTEQLKDQLSDQQRVIFDFLRANPDETFTYREIGDNLDMHKQTVRKHIVERGLVDESFRMNGSVFEGILTHERENNAKHWYIRPEVENRLDEPQERIVEKEVPRYEEMAHVIDEHYPLVAPFVFITVVGVLLKGSQLVVNIGVFGDFGMMLFGAGIAGLGTMLAIAYRETSGITE